MRKLKFGILVLIMSLFVTACGCQKQTINVSFDTDGGSEVKTQIIEKGNTAEVPSEPTKEGYTFEGWYRSDTATEEFDFSTKLDKDTTLYAKWSMKVSTEVEKPEKDDKEEKVELSVNKTSVKLEVGKSTTIKVTTNSDKKVTWSTSDKKIATVKDGKITAVKVGSATITVTVDGKKETIKVTVVKKAETTAKTTTTTKKVVTTSKKEETTKVTTKPVTTVDPDKTKLSNALQSIKAKTINKAGVDLKYSYDGCTIENTKNTSSSDKNIVTDGKVSKVYRGESSATITSEYKVTCGKYSDTKTVKHTVPKSEYSATASQIGQYYVLDVRANGVKLKTPYTVTVDEGRKASYSATYEGATTIKNRIKEGKTYDLTIDRDTDTTYTVKLTKIYE